MTSEPIQPPASRRPAVARPADAARRDLGRRGHQLRAVGVRRGGRRAVPVRGGAAGGSRTSRRPASARRVDVPDLARLRPRGRPGPAVRLPRARPVRPVAAGCATTRRSCCSTRTRGRSTATSRPRAAGLRLRRRPAAATPCATTATRRRTSRGRSSCTTPSDDWGGRPAGRRRRGPTRSSTSCTCAASPSGTRASREPLRGHVRRARPPGRDRAPRPTSGVTAVELLPVHQFVARGPPAPRRGLRNYWGYNSIGYFAPHAGVRVRYRRRAGRRVQGDGAGAARGRHRGDPRRGLQPHRGGRTSRARRCRFRGIDNRGYYRLQPDEPRRYADYTGCGNTLHVAPPARAAA